MTKSIYIDADCWIEETNPSTNYGAWQLMVVDGNSSGYERRSLVNLDLSAEDNTLVSATLFLFCQDAIPNNTITVKRITSSWTESGVTWNNKPTTTDVNLTTFASGGVNDIWHEIDVTNIIIDCINNTNYGMMFLDVSDQGGDTGFRTSENVNAPYIVINYGDKYVDISTGNDTDSGDTWALAYLTVKKGIDNYIAGTILHIVEGDYSAQAAIDLNKNLELVCEDYGGGNASPPLTVVLPPTV